MRRVLGDGAMSVAGVLTLLLALVAFDDRVREQAAAIVGGGNPSARLVGFGEQARDLAMVVLQAARDQGLEHAPLMIFALAATVLVLFMLRT